MSSKSFDQGFTLVRNADVEVVQIPSDGTTGIIVDQKHQHIFGAKSSITDAVKTSGVEAVRTRLNGGTFFFHNDDVKGDALVSYRNRDYNGFIHTDDSVSSLIEHIGYTTDFKRAQFHNNSTNRLRLQNIHSSVEMNIAQYGGQGGEMNSQLSFAWDPFQSHVRAVFELVRLICANGMVGMSSFMNTKIPVVNEWKHHMEIADKQIQNKIQSIVNRRMEVMALPQSRASLRDCQRVTDACHSRLENPMNINSPSAVKHIKTIAYAADPRLHLQNHYNDVTFNDRRLSEQAASHLTEFTVWNMLTELATHTYESAESSNTALYKLANELLIDRGDSRLNSVSNGQKMTQVAQSVKFDDIDSAFIGDMVAV